MAKYLKSARLGGVALLWEESELYELEETKARGPNVITFELMMGTDRYYVVGRYIPPYDVTGTMITTIEQAMAEMPKECIPLIVGDLNIDLDNPRDDRDEVAAEAMDALDVSCLTPHFGHRRGRLIK